MFNFVLALTPLARGWHTMYVDHPGTQRVATHLDCTAMGASMNLRTIRIDVVIILGLSTVLGGCVAAAVGAAAGAAGAIAYTERGASTRVNASVAESTAAAEEAFDDMGIAVTGRETEGDREVEIRGERGDMDVDVHVEREDAGLTQIDVSARESTLDYDREYARSVLSEILERL